MNTLDTVPDLSSFIKTNENPKFQVFHYTCKPNFVRILATRKLLPTCSELKAPPPEGMTMRWNAETEVEEPWDPSYDIKPVVWFSTSANARAEHVGNESSYYDKTEFRIGLSRTNDFESWRSFAKKNNADKKWRRTIEQGRRPKTWCVHEGPIDLTGIPVSLCRKINGEWISLFEHPEALIPDAKPGKKMVLIKIPFSF